MPLKGGRLDYSGLIQAVLQILLDLAIKKGAWSGQAPFLTKIRYAYLVDTLAAVKPLGPDSISN